MDLYPLLYKLTTNKKRTEKEKVFAAKKIQQTWRNYKDYKDEKNKKCKTFTEFDDQPIQKRKGFFWSWISW